MRFWLKDSERRPDPAPVQTDDRTVFLAGSILWVVAFVVAWLAIPGPDQAGLIWTCVAGLVIGLIGLAWSIWHRRAQ